MKGLGLAHRFSFVTFRGDPGAFEVCHRCDNPSCVRPSHLFLGTRRDNVDDMVAKGRASGGERHWMVKLSAGAVDAIRQRSRAGESITELAREFGVSHAVVGGIKYGRGWRSTDDGTAPPAPGRAPRGEANGPSKLTEALVLEIRRRSAAGESQSAIAAAVGVSRSNISYVARGKTWAHVPAEAS